MLRTDSEGVFCMKRLSESLFLLGMGGCIYYGVELLFRGFSHWSMFLLGGLCFVFFYLQGSVVHWQDSLLIQTVRCMIFVVSSEFITGIIVNKWLLMDVWDYSDMPFQLFGQICLPFSVIFAGLCVMGILLSSYTCYWIFREEKPHFYII